MKTSQPISTISYNTPRFLRHTLEELQKAKIISFWAFIYHEPEDDEAGSEYHAHVYMIPSKMIQTDDVKELLKEYDPKNPDLPLGCINVVSSDFGNWYLYSIHDRAYLAMKHQSRKYHYCYDQVETSDKRELHCHVHEIDILESSPYQILNQAIKDNLDFSAIVRQGKIPIQQIRNFEKAYFYLMEDRTFRNGKASHTPNENLKIESVKRKIQQLKLKHYDLCYKQKLDDFSEVEQIEEKVKQLESWLANEKKKLELYSATRRKEYEEAGD